MCSEEPFPGSHFHLYCSPPLNKVWMPLVLLCWDFPFSAVNYSNIWLLLRKETFWDGVDANASRRWLLCWYRFA